MNTTLGAEPPASLLPGAVTGKCGVPQMARHMHAGFYAACAGELYLEFTQISAAQPERPYGFGVQVLEDEKYKGKALIYPSM